MKRVFLSFMTVALAFATVVSCNKDNTIVTPKDETEDTPGEDPGEDPGENPTIDGITVEVQYYGDYYENGCGNYSVYFVKEDKSYLAMDLLAPLANTLGDVVVPTGKFVVAASFSASKSGDAIPGFDDEDGYACGSMTVDGDDNVEAYVTSGYLNITKSGDKYTFSWEVTFDEETSFEAKGSVSSEVEVEVKVSVDSDAIVAYYYGDYYGNNSGDWEVYIEPEDAEYYIHIEFLTSVLGANGIKAGTYTVATSVDDAVADNVIPGYEGDDGYCYGSYTYDDEYVDLFAQSGSMEIVANDDDTYTFSWSFRDEEYEEDFSGSFTGTVTVYDESEDVDVESISCKKANRQKPSTNSFSSKKTYIRK